jgi:hypothetical protein
VGIAGPAELGIAGTGERIPSRRIPAFQRFPAFAVCAAAVVALCKAAQSENDTRATGTARGAIRFSAGTSAARGVILRPTMTYPTVGT